MTLDAYGGRRSSRSKPTGPGSRGGKRTDPKYWSDWRAANPEYRARESRRTTLRRERARDAVGGDVTITEVCRAIVAEEVAASSQRQVAARLGIDHAGISRWLSDHRTCVTSDVIDLVVLVFTMKRVLDTKARLRRERRAARLAAERSHARPK